MDSSPLMRPRHISISVRPIQNFFNEMMDSAPQVIEKQLLQMGICYSIEWRNWSCNYVLSESRFMHEFWT